MARKERKKSQTGIYHVMLRGINHQNIFHDQNDFDSMVRAIRDVQFKRDEEGHVEHRDNCTFYAYCILHNHLHLLVKEGDLSISELMKRLQDRYVIIYNRKYDRVGHLFQDRFASEPVDDEDYLRQLIRYIHRNPVKALEVSRPEDYRYSSWREYLGIIKGSDPLINQICDARYIVELFGAQELEEFVNRNGEDSEQKVMDMDSFRRPMSEAEAKERLTEISQCEHIEYFKQLKKDQQLDYLAQLVAQGASIRQASRFSSLSFTTVWNYLHPAEAAAMQEERRRARELKRKLKND